MTIKKLDMPHDVRWGYRRTIRFPICAECKHKRGVYYTLKKNLMDVPRLPCACIKEGVEDALNKVYKDMDGVGIYTHHMLGYEKGLVILEAHVIIFEDDPIAHGKFKIKNLNKHYRKV